MDLALTLSKLGISKAMTQDVTLLLVIVLVSFVFGLLIGRFKMVTILINLYVAFAIVSVIPEKVFSDYTIKLMVFLGIVAVLTLLGKKMFEIYISGSGSGFLWRVFVMSFLDIMFLLSAILLIIPEKEVLGFISKNAYDYLAQGWMPLIWTSAPLVFLYAIHKKINR